MSVTYSFVCDDCKIRCWAGQSQYIYGYNYISKFLHNHIDHNLRFINDHVFDERSDYYEDADESDTSINPKPKQD